MAILVQSNKKPSVSFPSQTGSIVTFNSQYAGLPLKSHSVAVTGYQSGSGTPSPSNPRALNGWSGLNIIAVGGNAWDETTKQGYYHTLGGYYVNVSGQLCSNSFIAVQPETTYRFVKPRTHGDVLYYGSDKTYLNQYRASVPKNGTFTTPSGCYYITINLGNNYGATYNNDVIIAYPSGTTATINFGQTVYGGEYDARTGVLTITHGFIASYNGETINEPWISSMDEYVEGTTPTNGAQVVYPLATPRTIQLPPCPIDTLEGVNNIWADTGETTASIIKIGG